MQTIVRLKDGRLVISRARALPSDAVRYWSDREKAWKEPVLVLDQTHDELEAMRLKLEKPKDPWEIDEAGEYEDRTTWPP